MTEHDLGIDTISSWEAALKKERYFTQVQNSVVNCDVEKVVLNNTVIDDEPVFRHDVFPEGLKSWIFAGLNVLRVAALKKLKVKNFEFSQSYIAFYDKLERANYFLELNVENRKTEIDDRTLQYCFKDCVSDGGQWDMFINLIRKYGVVPKKVFPESKTSGKTVYLRRHLKVILLDGAKKIRECKEEEIKATKMGILKLVHRVLALHYGFPPRSFRYEFKDKEKNVHTIEMTPVEFAEQYIPQKYLTQAVSIINDPRNEYNRLYTVQYLGNFWKVPVVYLNVDLKTMKALVADSIVKKKEPLFFGSDFGKQVEKKLGIMHENVFMWKQTYDCSISLKKEDRLRYGLSLMTHAMVICGINEEKEGVQYRVENSHGTKNGKDGFLTMSERWFEEYAFQIVVMKDSLSTEHQEILKKNELIVLPAWDPMGSLAQ